jgi:hypothetical protein
MLADGVGVVRLVDHENDRDVGQLGDGEAEDGRAHAGVVGAAEPDTVVAALDGDVAVDEHGGLVGLERLDDMLGADGDIVVAEDAEALRGLEGAEDLGGDAGGAPGGGVREGTAADEVAGQEHDVWVDAVDALDGVDEEPGLGVLDEVNVGELDHAETDEGVGKVRDSDLPVGDLEVVTCPGPAVEGYRGCRRGTSNQECAAGHGREAKVRSRVETIGHMS